MASYIPYLIARYSTGLDQSVQPWLLPDEAQETLFDGYVYRGVWNKRPGYSQFATGQEGGSPYTESRIVVEVADVAMTGVIDSVNRTYTLTATAPVRRGTFTVVGSNPAQTVTDDGVGEFTGDGTGTINYTTGAVSITFDAAPTAGTVLTTYDYHPGLPVMMVANFLTASNVKELVVADTRNVNVYNATTNRLEYLAGNTTFTGTSANFFSWVNYPDASDDNRLLFVNNTNSIQQYDGTTIRDYPVLLSSASIAPEAYGTGDGTAGPYAHTAASVPVALGTMVVTAGAQVVTDDGEGGFTGDGTGTINYVTGGMSITFTGVVGGTVPITCDYDYMTSYVQSALHLFQIRDRLVIVRPIYNGGKTYGQRLLISGTGSNCDVFLTTATGAGVIDLPDTTWIFAAAFNRDDLVLFTESATWILEYTGNDVVPFFPKRLDSSRGSGAPYSGISYLGRTTTTSPRGFILTDGYQVQRMDDKIPDYSYNEIDQTNFKLAFTGAVDEDRDHYLIHPSPGQSSSDRILVTNYEEDNFSVYRLPLSCMGSFVETFNKTWDDLDKYANWDEMAAELGNWESFSYSKDLPFAVGGGHEGQIWRLNLSGIEDYPVKIRAMTVIDDSTLEIETDFQNYAFGDYIFISGIQGMSEANDKQGAIDTIETANTTFRIRIPTERFSSYTGGGTASRVIPFESTTKKFNPFADRAQKIRCGYLYMYVSASNTGLTRNVNIQNITQAFPAVITANNHQFKDNQIITIYGVAGMTQINALASQITVIDENTFSMDQIDSSAYGVYTGGGVAAGPEDCFLDIQVITNDENDITQIQNSSLETYATPYRINCTPSRRDEGSKRWVKIFINQTARFIQFKITNTQALSTIKIQAMMPGFMGVGRLI